MRTMSECQERAKQCYERALIMTATVDRARWLQLAKGWEALSRAPLQSGPSQRNEPAGFWRGELSKG
jgi:hypothetical protein